LFGRELESQVGESDAELSENDARTVCEIAKCGKEGISKGNELSRRELFEVVGDLANELILKVSIQRSTIVAQSRMSNSPSCERFEQRKASVQ
jgi:hypothetical protein